LEAFTAEPVDRADACGVRWQGVRLATRPAKRELHDLAIELEYLTVGASNVLKFVYRVRNLRGTEQRVVAGLRLICALGSTPERLELRGDGIAHRPTPRGAQYERRGWGALVNATTGRTMLLVAEGNFVSLDDMGLDGRCLGGSDELRLAGHQTLQRVYYLVLADSYDSAGEYLVLRACP
jgi:hypothetical protein